MIRKQSSMETTVVASDDGKHTFEILRKWDDSRRTGIVIELYPTISAEKEGETDNPLPMDLSTMHLMNHVRDFDWGAVRIVNLYSTVFTGKPTTSMLTQDTENVAYIEDILERADSSDMDIVVAWGSSLATHMNTVETKSDILRMMKDRGLQSKVKCIVAGAVGEEPAQGTHPLFLGLHHGRDEWTLETFDIDKALAELDAYIGEKAEKRKEQKKDRMASGVPGSISDKVSEGVKNAAKKKAKGGKPDVPENQEQAGHDGTGKRNAAV